MTVSVRLSSEVEKRLDALAARTGRKRSFYIKEAIELHLDELEEAYWADEVVQRYESSGKKSRPWSEAKEALDL